MLPKSAIALVVLLSSTLLAQTAWAGCFYETSVNSQQVEITPQTDCLEVSLEGDTCTRNIHVFLTNNCEQALVGTYEAGWGCAEATCSHRDDETGVDVEPGQRAHIYEKEFEDGEDVTHHYPVILGEDEIDIAVTFNATTVDTDTSCSHTSARPSASWVIATLALFGAALFRRRRSRRLQLR